MPRGRTGHCRWCDGPILFPAGHKRAGETVPGRTWHGPCADAYKLAAWGQEQRAFCWKRDAGMCAACGVVAVGIKWRRNGTYYNAKYDGLDVSYVVPVRQDDWDADHIRPLWSAPPDMTLDQRAEWFGPDNLQTLCRTCHKAKTAREAAERATVRRPALPLFCAAA
jgi:5-methylcytosine-specific restriction endonuclease McrA